MSDKTENVLRLYADNERNLFKNYGSQYPESAIMSVVQLKIGEVITGNAQYSHNAGDSMIALYHSLPGPFKKAMIELIRLEGYDI